MFGSSGIIGNVSSDDWIKGNPAWPGGSLTSRPTWSKPRVWSTTPAFSFAVVPVRRIHQRGNWIEKSNLTMPYQIDQVERTFPSGE